MVGRAAPPRTWRRALALAGLTVWLPVAVPLVVGPLHECGHCVSTYLSCAPIVPGVLAPVLFDLRGAWFYVAGVLVALLLFGGLGLVLRELPRPGSVVAQWVVIVAVALQAYVFALALRA